MVIASNVKALSRDFHPGEVVRASRVYESGCMVVMGSDGAEAYVGDHEVLGVTNAIEEMLDFIRKQVSIWDADGDSGFPLYEDGKRILARYQRSPNAPASATEGHP